MTAPLLKHALDNYFHATYIDTIAQTQTDMIEDAFYCGVATVLDLIDTHLDWTMVHDDWLADMVESMRAELHANGFSEL